MKTNELKQRKSNDEATLDTVVGGGGGVPGTPSVITMNGYQADPRATTQVKVRALKSLKDMV